MRYNYCPKCGTKLIEKLTGDEGLVPFCETCNKLWFDSFADSSIILVVNEFDEIALLKQGYISDKYCTLVAGYIKPGETAEETAYREVEEEIGVSLETLEFIGTRWFPHGEVLMHGFIGTAKKKELVLSSEVDSAQWVPAEKVGDMIFPDSPENTASYLYKIYINRKNNI